MIARHRHILHAITRVELAKRYSGSVMGWLWAILYPILFLMIYLFVYLVIFKSSPPGSSALDYVLYVFAALVPYICFMDAITSGCHAIKQNIHLVKNVMMPIELIPARYVAVSMVGQAAGLILVLLLALVHGSWGAHLLLLPVAIILQAMFLLGLVWILSALAVALPDVNQFVSLTVMLLMFVSPIGYKPEAVPAAYDFMVWANPVFYMIEMFRAALIPEPGPVWLHIGLFAALALGCFMVGAAFFRRFKGVLVDYE